MAATLKASDKGLKIIDLLRIKKGWSKREKAWYELAYTSESTLRRFWKKQPISYENFVKICTVINANWQDIFDDSQAELLEPEDIPDKPSFALPEKIVPVRNWVGSQEINTLKSQILYSDTRAINISPLQPTDSDNKYPRGVWIPNLRCLKVWGRDNFSEEVLHHLSDPLEASILSLCGSAGYGKTEVARKVAMAALGKDLFADVLWVKARDTEFSDGQISRSERDEALSWNQLLQEIAYQLNGCSVKRVHQLIKQEKRLIVLDNAETAQLEDILPKLNEMLNPSRVLLTSRFQTNASYVGIINISPLEENWAYKLLQDEAKYKKVPALLQASNEELKRVYHLSCGAPLALHFIVGRVLYDGTLKPVLSALEQASGDVEKIYEFSLKTAWEKISDATKNILYYMGNSDASVTWEELSGVKQVKELDWNIARRELRQWYLIEDETDAKNQRRYNLHPWVRRSLRASLMEKWQPSLQELENITNWMLDLDI